MIALVSPRGVSAIQLTTIEVGPGARIPSFSLTFAPSSPHLLLLSGRPARRIQSDSDPKWSSACRFSAGCSHGTVQSDLPYPSSLKNTRAPSGRPPLTFSRSSLDSLLAGFLFFFLILDVALLHKQPLTFELDKLPWWIKRVWFPSSASPPFSLLLKSVWVASWRYYSLFSLSTREDLSMADGFGFDFRRRKLHRS